MERPKLRHFFETSRRAHDARFAHLAATGSPSRKRLRQQISVFLISAGASLLILTIGTYGWARYEQQRLMAQMLEGETAKGASEEPRKGTLLSIPRIHLSAMIVEGTSKTSLLRAPGHLENTAEPGAEGNSVVAGHRDTFFRRLSELERGDDILLTRGREQLHFVVTKKFVVDPNDVSVTRPSPDTRLTLVTCYPTYYVGPAPQRLIVVAELQAQDSAKSPVPANLSRLP